GHQAHARLADLVGGCLAIGALVIERAAHVRDVLPAWAMTHFTLDVGHVRRAVHRHETTPLRDARAGRITGHVTRVAVGIVLRGDLDERVDRRRVRRRLPALVFLGVTVLTALRADIDVAALGGCGQRRGALLVLLFRDDSLLDAIG